MAIIVIHRHQKGERKKYVEKLLAQDSNIRCDPQNHHQGGEKYTNIAHKQT